MARSMNWWASWRVHRRMNWWVARDMNWWVHRRGAGRIMSGRVMRWVSGRKMSWWASGRVNRRVSRGLVMVMVVVVVVMVVTGSGGFYRGVRATTVVRWKRTIDDSLSLFTKNSGEAAQQEQRHHKTPHLCLFSGHSEVS